MFKKVKMKIETRRIIVIYLYLYNIYLYGVRSRLYKFYKSLIINL